MNLNAKGERESKGRKKRFEKVRQYCRGDVGRGVVARGIVELAGWIGVESGCGVWWRGVVEVAVV